MNRHFILKNSSRLVLSISEEEFDEVEEEAPSRTLGHSKAPSGMLPTVSGANRYNRDDDEESYFSEKSEEVDEMEDSRAVSEEQNYSMDYADVEGEDDGPAKPKVKMMSFAGIKMSYLFL